jgi:type II secretion system protein D
MTRPPSGKIAQVLLAAAALAAAAGLAVFRSTVELSPAEAPAFAVQETLPAATPLILAQLPPAESDLKLPPVAASPAGESGAVVPVQFAQEVPSDPADSPAEQADYQLRSLSADAFKQRLELAFGHPLPPVGEAEGEWLRFSVDAGDGSPVLVAANRNNGAVRIVGRPQQLKAWRSIIAALDAPEDPQQITKMVAGSPAAAPQIRQAVGVMTQPVQAPQVGEGDQAAIDAAEALLGPVQIEVVEGTDLFVIRGNPRDVERVLEVIRQIEEMSRVSRPEVRVLPLKQADPAVVAEAAQQLFAIPAADGQFSLGPYYGPLTVQPLASPRALLLAGSPQTVARAAELVSQLDVAGAKGVNELRVFKLKNALASELAPVLQRAFRGESVDEQSPTAGASTDLASLLKLVTIDAEGRQRLESGVLAGATVNAETRSNALVVTAAPESMSLLTALIEQLDQPPAAAAELKVFTIKNGDAVALAEMLESLFGVAEQQQGAAGAGVFSLRFSVDERTNSIIAAGSTDELIVVEAVLLRLDAADARQRLNQVYKLKNASAQDVATALQDWLERKREIEQTAPGTASPFQQIEREVVVVPEVASNSLIVSATPEYYREIESIVMQLDEQAPMVMIQVLIGEVSLGDADEFGVELGLQDSLLFDRSNLTNLVTTSNTVTQGGGGTTTTTQVIQGADLDPGFRFGDPNQLLPNSGSDRSLATAGSVAAQGLSSFAVNRVSPDLGFGGFVLSASSSSVNFLLRALQESRRLEILSRPQIMALDNQPGRAFVGQIVPIILGSTITPQGLPINSVQQQPVGLELVVTPRISPEDLVVLQVSAAKRELQPLDQGVPVAVSADGQPVLAPIIASTEAQTTVSAVSGQTVVLSGLLTKRDEVLHRRVPLLADVPLLGSLFRYDSSRQRRTELLIVMTPHVVRSRHDSEVLKQIESARMSWCLADVVDLHGPAGLRSRGDMLGAAEAPALYPTATPEEVGQIMPPGEELISPTPSEAYQIPAGALPPPSP